MCSGQGGQERGGDGAFGVLEDPARVSSSPQSGEGDGFAMLTDKFAMTVDSTAYTTTGISVSTL